MTFHLTQRQAHILWATVDHYISTAEPVGSKALAQEYELPISPATIRNVMGGLEKSGLLFQPHTSAGRVPSDSGYRLYVDRLITPSHKIAAHIAQLLSERLSPQRVSLETLLRHAAQILAQLSGCLALVTLPQSPQITLRHVQLVLIEPHKAMLILVTHDYQTQSTLLDLPELSADPPLERESLEQELSILTNFLNHHITGCTVRDLQTLDWQELGQEFQHYSSLVHHICQKIVSRVEPDPVAPVLFGGLSEVLRQPEFTELKQAHTLIDLLEADNALLWPLMWDTHRVHLPLEEAGDLSKVNIKIGTEHSLEPIQSCTLVSTSYQHRDSAWGYVGVIGPTRMAYEKVIALVEGTSSYLSAALG
ncbi:heat-inducible transcriptional repressor HrcA [Lyngbya confervoides]|uniref:Heat-inducible transcription repressor HrcA n=1 Tax=Lyngbya confervoides BDU141951 TaxID=1574623 RepID=A0ABD4T1M0_9CYAN|nr:heat-inducible transcriptional repressor HrcA [Lyngbya confervoides]MCM1982182.1 heat-inducible transcriptional repressor HrcA [Lyngbya confervoides BDU141951]